MVKDLFNGHEGKGSIFTCTLEIIVIKVSHVDITKKNHINTHTKSFMALCLNHWFYSNDE
jgi:hypothetical protein